MKKMITLAILALGMATAQAATKINPGVLCSIPQVNRILVEDVPANVAWVGQHGEGYKGEIVAKGKAILSNHKEGTELCMTELVYHREGSEDLKMNLLYEITWKVGEKPFSGFNMVIGPDMTYRFNNKG